MIPVLLASGSPLWVYIIKPLGLLLLVVLGVLAGMGLLKVLYPREEGKKGSWVAGLMIGIAVVGLMLILVHELITTLP